MRYIIVLRDGRFSVYDMHGGRDVETCAHRHRTAATRDRCAARLLRAVSAAKPQRPKGEA